MGHAEFEALAGYPNRCDNQVCGNPERLGIYTWGLPIYETDLSHGSLQGVIKEHKWYAGA